MCITLSRALWQYQKYYILLLCALEAFVFQCTMSISKILETKMLLLSMMYVHIHEQTWLSHDLYGCMGVKAY